MLLQHWRRVGLPRKTAFCLLEMKGAALEVAALFHLYYAGHFFKKNVDLNKSSEELTWHHLPFSSSQQPCEVG